MDDPPRDTGTAIDLRNARRSQRQLVGEQGEVGAGQHEYVEAGNVQQGSDGPADRVHRHRLAAQLGFGQIDQRRAAMADDGAIGGETCGEIVDVGLAHCCLRPEHANHPAL